MIATYTERGLDKSCAGLKVEIAEPVFDAGAQTFEGQAKVLASPDDRFTVGEVRKMYVGKSAWDINE